MWLKSMCSQCSFKTAMVFKWLTKKTKKTYWYVRCHNWHSENASCRVMSEFLVHILVLGSDLECIGRYLISVTTRQLVPIYTWVFYCMFPFAWLHFNAPAFILIVTVAASWTSAVAAFVFIYFSFGLCCQQHTSVLGKVYIYACAIDAFLRPVFQQNVFLFFVFFLCFWDVVMLLGGVCCRAENIP